MTALGAYLAETRISQTTLAARIGVEQSMVCRWAKGERIPSTPHAFAIEKATGGKVPASYWSTFKPKRRSRRSLES